MWDQWQSRLLPLSPGNLLFMHPSSQRGAHRSKKLSKLIETSVNSSSCFGAGESIVHPLATVSVAQRSRDQCDREIV